MTGPQVLVGDPNRRQAPPERGDPAGAWRMARLVGLALMLVAYGDMFLGVFPLGIGDPQWEFGTVSRLMDSLPLVAMATLLVVAGSVAIGSVAWARLVGAWSAAFGILLLAALALYALTIPLALGAVEDAVARTGLQKAIAKTLLQGVIYPATFIGLGYFSLRRHRAAG